jgi:hypothetical protein
MTSLKDDLEQTIESLPLALMSVMLALENLNAMMLNTLSNVHKHVASVLKNVEEWLGSLSTHSFIF